MVWLFFKNWFWFFLPIILAFPAKFFYLWWKRWEVWYPSKKWILLELKPPRENLKPFKAMEDVFTVLWGIYDGPNWREVWCEGEPMLGGGLWFSFEIVSFGGDIHFYMRVPEGFRSTAESTLYGEYPQMEISLASDYTQKVPQDIPNEDWDLYGEDFTLFKPDYYPIKTYPKFFEENIGVKEEKRIDPIDSLLESLSQLKEGDQVWIQIVTNPILDNNFPWQGKARAKIRQIGSELTRKWGLAPSAGTPGRPAWPPGELMPKERETIEAIENKIKKHAFQTWIRSLHIYQKNKPHTRGAHRIARTYFNHFATEHLNFLVFWGPTRTRIHYVLKERRLFLRKRKQFRSYVARLPSLWPRTMTGEPLFSFGLPGLPRGPGIRGTCILNTEELATIFHFPAKIELPSMAQVESKKGGPPARLPI